ncbi:hypothetical protein SAMN05421831_101180 [Allopseudospirillum japonicum]|uniref:Lipoprotein n=1 Tax=Allopseudospirillum japonicum TaxID=64971 RepID=A0A1H6QA67_9GAMM|nr:hypothetical protein [Allopseudospirillum japonicum]SEI38736.1 hypothetical protein SAMN05421831_101180 [Allopseudospirillum japonicum]
MSKLKLIGSFLLLPLMSACSPVESFSQYILDKEMCQALAENGDQIKNLADYQQKLGTLIEDFASFAEKFGFDEVAQEVLEEYQQMADHLEAMPVKDAESFIKDQC